MDEFAALARRFARRWRRRLEEDADRFRLALLLRLLDMAEVSLVAMVDAILAKWEVISSAQKIFVRLDIYWFLIKPVHHY